MCRPHPPKPTASIQVNGRMLGSDDLELLDNREQPHPAAPISLVMCRLSWSLASAPSPSRSVSGCTDLGRDDGSGRRHRADPRACSAPGDGSRALTVLHGGAEFGDGGGPVSLFWLIA